MKLLDLALQTVQAQQTTPNHITAIDVAHLLQNVKGTTFASIITVTKVGTAAQHKQEQIFKVTTATVQLFNNITDDTSVYKNAVERSVNKLSNEQTNFEVSETWFEHTACYSVVQHKTTKDQYLYAIYNNAKSVYVHNNELISTVKAASYCTPSAAKQILDHTPTLNKTNNVEHNVIVRTIKLSSIVELKAMKQVLTV